MFKSKASKIGETTSAVKLLTERELMGAILRTEFPFISRTVWLYMNSIVLFSSVAKVTSCLRIFRSNLTKSTARTGSFPWSMEPLVRV